LERQQGAEKRELSFAVADARSAAATINIRKDLSHLNLESQCQTFKEKSRLSLKKFSLTTVIDL
jgi:hypothetical protein